MPPNRAVHVWTLCGRDIHIPKGVYCLLVLGLVLKFTRFLFAKTSANKRFFIICLHTLIGFAVAKVVKYFGLSKKNRFGGRFFGVESKV